MQTVAWDLARAFSRIGHRVTVVTAELPGRNAAFEDEGVEIVPITGTSWRRYGNNWWRGSREAYERIASTCDVVLGVSAAANALLPLHSQDSRSPFVMQAHGTSVGEVISKWRSRSTRQMISSVKNIFWIAKDFKSYRKFDAIVAVGPRIANDMRAAPTSWAVSPCKCQLIPNGIDTDVFKPDAEQRALLRASLHWGDDTRIIVSASRLHKQKGIDLGLVAFAGLAQKLESARYLIVGDGPERANLEALAQRLGVGQKVHFAGGVPREELPGFLQGADVMLFTTTHVEGLPLNVLESLAIGLPCVVSSHLLKDMELGPWLTRVSPTDELAVSEALKRTLTIETSVVSRLPERYSLKRCAESYIDLFARLRRERKATAGLARRHV
ncbi:glycosyltransferase family 4 protein [Paraburkholderia bannensis]|uniref:glycosyltransferase family 4 protein n=1 Tax=Paraburkholderia bannensis TaxID=765414 RepID=UPI002AC36217|nr:glycosyltransferase family 4 protein [Paraburkholderia bannensis]